MNENRTFAKLRQKNRLIVHNFFNAHTDLCNIPAKASKIRYYIVLCDIEEIFERISTLQQQRERVAEEHKQLNSTL